MIYKAMFALLLLLPPQAVQQLLPLYEKARLSFFGKSHYEYSFTYTDEGNVLPITSDRDYNQNSVRICTNTAGIVHTHPAGTDKRPSPNDIEVAKRVGIPNYVLSQYELWVAMPDGRVQKVADVKFKKGKVELR